MTQSGIEPATFRLVAQCFVQLRHQQRAPNHTVQHSITYISPRPAPHSTSLPCMHFATHPAVIPLPSLHLADLHPTSFPFTSLQFISLHVSISNSCSWQNLISSVLCIHFTSVITSLHFTSLHFTSVITSLSLFLKVLGLEGNLCNYTACEEYRNV